MQALAGHLQQSEAGDTGKLNTCLITLGSKTQFFLNLLRMFAGGHVDEVDNDQATNITDSELTGNLFSCLKVGSKCGIIDMLALGGTGGVHINGGECFGRIEHD